MHDLKLAAAALFLFCLAMCLALSGIGCTTNNYLVAPVADGDAGERMQAVLPDLKAVPDMTTQPDLKPAPDMVHCQGDIPECCACGTDVNCIVHYAQDCNGTPPVFWGCISYASWPEGSVACGARGQRPCGDHDGAGQLWLNLDGTKWGCLPGLVPNAYVFCEPC